MQRDRINAIRQYEVEINFRYYYYHVKYVSKKNLCTHIVSMVTVKKNFLYLLLYNIELFIVVVVSVDDGGGNLLLRVLVVGISGAQIKSIYFFCCCQKKILNIRKGEVEEGKKRERKRKREKRRIIFFDTPLCHLLVLIFFATYKDINALFLKFLLVKAFDGLL